MTKYFDENGVPTLAGALAMFNAIDEAAADRAWLEAEKAREDAEEDERPFVCNDCGGGGCSFCDDGDEE